MGTSCETYLFSLAEMLNHVYWANSLNNVPTAETVAWSGKGDAVQYA